MLRQIWHAIRFFAAARVRSRDELDAALKRTPRFIVIEGTEALRAYAASLAYRGGQEAAAMEEAAAMQPPPAYMPAYMVVPTVGRIRDGYRQHPQQARRGAAGGLREGGARKDRRRKEGRRADRISLQAGMGTVIAASTALAALLGAEWLLWPSNTPELVRGPHHVAAPPPRGADAPLPTHAPVPLPTVHEQVIHVLVPLLVLAAFAAMVFLVWQAVGPGRPVRVSWRVAHRVQGQLVIARIRTKTA